MSIVSQLAAYARENHLPIYSICEMKGDSIATEVVTPANAANHIYSVSKNFTTTAFGFLYDRGLLSLDDTVYDIFSGDYPDMPAAWKDCRVCDVMTQRPGVLIPGFLDIDCDDVRTYGSDYLAYTLAHAPTVKPGTQFCYTDSNFYLISRICAKVTGIPTQDFLRDNLFLPLEFQNYAWMTDNIGHAMGGTGLILRVCDMAKFGMLYMNGGVFGGKRLLSEEWCRIATVNYADIDGENGYGYSFRKLASIPDAFFCSGAFGQVIRCYPRTGSVIAWQGYDPDRLNFGLEQLCDRLGCGLEEA